MNDGVLVRMQHRLAHAMKKPQTLLDGTLMATAILGEWETLDILHDEPRSSIGQGVRIVEPGNRRMIELGQSPLLTRETFAAHGRHPGVTQEFDRNQASNVLPL